MLFHHPRPGAPDTAAYSYNAPATPMVQVLFVAFGTVVGLAQHLAVVNRGGSATAPCGDMVGIHLRDAVYPRAVTVARDCAQGAVGDSTLTCLVGLTLIRKALGRFLEYECNEFGEVAPLEVIAWRKDCFASKYV